MRRLAAFSGRFPQRRLARWAAVAGFACILFLHGVHAESCADNRTAQTVILEDFEVREARLVDVLEALTLAAEKATNQTYRPNFVIIGDRIGRLKVSFHLRQAPLAEALNRIAAMPGVRVSPRTDQTFIFSAKEG